VTFAQKRRAKERDRLRGCAGCPDDRIRCVWGVRDWKQEPSLDVRQNFHHNAIQCSSLALGNDHRISTASITIFWVGPLFPRGIFVLKGFYLFSRFPLEGRNLLEIRIYETACARQGFAAPSYRAVVDKAPAPIHLGREENSLALIVVKRST